MGGGYVGRGIVRGRCGWLEPPSVHSKLQFVDREHFFFPMKRDVESLGQKITLHRHLLVMRRSNLPGRYRSNVVVVGFNPSWPTRDRSRIEIISRRNQ